MRTTPFGRTGFNASPLGFGSAPVGYLSTERQRAARVLNLLLDAGVNLIDTAASYPGAETLIAETIGHRRSEFMLVSKCGSKVSGVTGAPWSADLIAQTIDRSLQNLRIDVLDVMLLHSCDLETLKKGEAIGALVKARDAGKIRFAGYSGDNEAAAWAAAHPEIAVLETSVSIADQVNVDLVLPTAQKNSLGVLAKRPIANAAWKEPAQQPGIYQGYASEYHKRLKAMGLKPAELGFSGDAATAWPEIALRFTLSIPGVHTAIIGTTNPDNATANVQHAAKGALPAEAVAKIRAAFTRAQSAASERWTGQT
jgi:aryl-alcohol dehydrogenase-like predicted oxidoreductase